MSTGSKAVLITGCSTGIGRATAEPPRPRGGYTVYATARKPESLADLEAAGCKTLALDVNDEASMQAAVDRGRARPRAPSARWSTTPATASRARSSRSRSTRCARQFETNVFGLDPDVPARAARACASRAGAGS